MKPRTEKKVFEVLRILKVFRYLPLYRRVTKYEYRRVARELPLFPGYVFTRLNPNQRLEVLKTQMIVRTIEVAEPRKMIHELRQISHAGRLPVDFKEVKSYSIGEHVRVKSGPFRGIEGYVQRRGKQMSLVLTLEILGSAIEVTVNTLDVEKTK